SLLIHQRGKPVPQWRCATGAASTGIIDSVIRDHQHVISSQSNIGNVSEDGGSLIGRHANALLIARNSPKRADAAAGTRTVFAEFDSPIPDGFRHPRTTGHSRGQGCSTHGS